MADGDPSRNQLPPRFITKFDSDHKHSSRICWEKVNEDLWEDIKPIYEDMSQQRLTTAQAEESFVMTLVSHLTKQGVLTQKLPRTYQNRCRRVSNTTNTISKLALTKNSARRNFHRDPPSFLNSVRVHNKIIRHQARSTTQKTLYVEEKKFCSNRFDFARAICQGRTKTNPTFDANECHTFFSNQFSNSSCTYSSLPSWVADIMPVNIEEPFDCSPILPKHVKATLKRCSSSSKPGANGISYYHLKNLPCTHLFLALLYSNTLLHSNVAPPSWCMGKITLIHKDGSTSEPGNFRPIALTSTIGKLFHKILASRLEVYLRQNSIINTTTQKGFLTGMNGVMEHVASMSAIIENARNMQCPLYITFLDLANAFGSISHQLINDMLVHIQLPASIIGYLKDLYSKLQAFVSTPDWNTDTFSIQRGVFQGDTISPIIFLLCFEPLVKLASQYPSKGYVPRIPIPDSESLPPVDSTIYLFWDEEQSSEPTGWYKCRVSSHTSDGLSTISYPDHSTETLDLRLHKWELARANATRFLLPSNPPPQAALPRIRERMKEPKSVAGKPHCAEAFADDLSIISSSKTDHQSTLDSIHQHSTSLDLVLKPPKCLSYCFSGKSSSSVQCFRLGNNHTVNVSTKPAKFLGKIIGSTPSATKKATSQKLRDDVLKVLNRIDCCNIRGEFKVWIYQNYFIPSLHFYLCVSNITPNQLTSTQRHVTRFLKSWLNLPKCATLASIFHPNSLGIRYLPHFHEQAQLTLVQTVEMSPDPLVQDIRPIFSSLPELSSNSLQAIRKARDAISVSANNSHKHISRRAKEDLLANHSSYWNNQVTKLTVQSKLLETTSLEETSHVWKRLMFALPAGQLSFLVRASIDTLPTPTSLARWNMKVSPSCPLCQQTSCTAKHVLSCCKSALDQGRYT